MAEVAERRWWIAAGLSVLQPGLGQVYNGRPRRAVLFVMAQLVMMLVAARLLQVWAFPAMVATFVVGFVVALVAVIEAGVDAFRHGAAFVPSRYDRAVVYLALLVGLLLLRLGFTAWLRQHEAQPFKIPSIESMAPTLVPGDYLYADRRPVARQAPVGAVIVLRPPYDPSFVFVERVVAGPGQRVELRDKRLVVDGRESVEPYVQHIAPDVLPGGESPRDDFGPFVVPAGNVFVLGDNRENSRDSRWFGPVPVANVLGTARGIYWSWDAEHARPRWERIGRPLR